MQPDTLAPVRSERDRGPLAPNGDLPSDPDWSRVELSSRRTGMSFQRTRMSADRTLMSVIRTALSLITFGFTLFQAFEHLYRTQVLSSADAAQRFGAALVLLGVVMLLVGIGYHVAFMLALRAERACMKLQGLVHAESPYPVSMTLVVAVLLLGIGVLATASTFFKHGPFG